MARILSQTLIRETQVLIRDQPPVSHLLAGRPRSSPLPTRSRLINVRARSGRPDKFVQIFEVDLDPATDGGASPSDGLSVAARRLDSAIYGVLVRHAAPGWLPFVPGASYWVPPRRRSEGLAELLRRMRNPMSDEEVMSLTTMRGWPSAAHLIGDMCLDPVAKSTEENSRPSDDEDR